MLNVSEKTIYRWINQGSLPAYRVNEQYRFNRAELLEWATSRRINVSVEIFDEPESNAAPLPGLVAALEAGGIFYRLGGADNNSPVRVLVPAQQLAGERHAKRKHQQQRPAEPVDLAREFERANQTPEDCQWRDEHGSYNHLCNMIGSMRRLTQTPNTEKPCEKEPRAEGKQSNHWQSSKQSGKRHQQEQADIVNEALTPEAILQTRRVRIVARRKK